MEASRRAGSSPAPYRISQSGFCDEERIVEWRLTNSLDSEWGRSLRRAPIRSRMQRATGRQLQQGIGGQWMGDQSPAPKRGAEASWMVGLDQDCDHDCSWSNGSSDITMARRVCEVEGVTRRGWRDTHRAELHRSSCPLCPLLVFRGRKRTYTASRDGYKVIETLV